MNQSKIQNILVRYGVSTLGLVLVAVGVALSIKSNLGTAPISCPPYVINLFNGSLTVGEWTMIMHLVFIVSQIVMLRKSFKLRYLMQIPAAIVFGLLTDAAIWAFSWVDASGYVMRLVLCVVSVAITALGVSLEVCGNSWMLAGEQTVAAIAEITKKPFGNMKIAFDISLMAFSMIFGFFAFGNVLGNGELMVVREGTLIQALLTGFLMKYTDPVCESVFGKAVKGE